MSLNKHTGQNHKPNNLRNSAFNIGTVVCGSWMSSIDISLYRFTRLVYGHPLNTCFDPSGSTENKKEDEKKNTHKKK